MSKRSRVSTSAEVTRKRQAVERVQVLTSQTAAGYAVAEREAICFFS